MTKLTAALIAGLFATAAFAQHNVAAPAAAGDTKAVAPEQKDVKENVAKKEKATKKHKKDAAKDAAKEEKKEEQSK